MFLKYVNYQRKKKYIYTDKNMILYDIEKIFIIHKLTMFSSFI